MLRLYLFRVPRIENSAQPVPLRRSKALALLAYLATIRQPQDRETLLALLWPEFDLDSARNNLRRELSLLKTTLGDNILHAERSRVNWHAAASWLDVAEFEAQLTTAKQHELAEFTASDIAAITAAVQLYRDDFLAGFAVPDSPAFEEWQFFQREELRQQFGRALQTLIAWHSGQGAFEAALPYARRQVALDPLHEPARHELMRLYALSGQHAAATRQYEEYARLLEQELGVAPENEISRLYQDIRQRRLEAVSSRPALPALQSGAPVPDTTAAVPAEQSAPNAQLYLCHWSACRAAMRSLRHWRQRRSSISTRIFRRNSSCLIICATNICWWCWTISSICAAQPAWWPSC